MHQLLTFSCLHSSRASVNCLCRLLSVLLASSSVDAQHIISDVRVWHSASKALLLCFFRYFQKLLSGPQIFHDVVALLLKAFRNLSTTLCTFFMQFRFSAVSFFDAGLQLPAGVAFCGAISDDCEVREFILEN